MLVRSRARENQSIDRSKARLIGVLAACATVAGCLGTASGAIGQTAQPIVKAEAIEHSTCVAGSGLGCETQNSGTTQAAAVPQLWDAAQQEEISQILLGFLYFVLPAGVGLSIFVHDKFDRQRVALKKQTEIVEMLPSQTLQH